MEICLVLQRKVPNKIQAPYDNLWDIESNRAKFGSD